MILLYILCESTIALCWSVHLAVLALFRRFWLRILNRRFLRRWRVFSKHRRDQYNIWEPHLFLLLIRTFELTTTTTTTTDSSYFCRFIILRSRLRVPELFGIGTHTARFSRPYQLPVSNNAQSITWQGGIAWRVGQWLGIAAVVFVGLRAYPGEWIRTKVSIGVSVN